jgi:hypothetical protein
VRKPDPQAKTAVAGIDRTAVRTINMTSVSDPVQEILSHLEGVVVRE